MRHIELRTRVFGHSPASIYPLLCDFKKYPEYTDTVRTVDVTQVDEDRIVSSWEVNFNRGILRWTEEDHFKHNLYRIDFRQIAGDIDHFAGHWIVREDEDACVILFVADLDLGLPGFNEMLEPIAELALRDNIRAILEGLLAQPIEMLLTNSVTEGGSLENDAS